jgi:hypothetical protein
LLQPYPFGFTEFFHYVEPRRILLAQTFFACTRLLPVKAFGYFHQLCDGFLDGDALLAAVVAGNNLRIFLAVVDPLRVGLEHGRHAERLGMKPTVVQLAQLLLPN